MKSPLDSPKWPNRWTPSPLSGSSEHKIDDNYHAHGSDDENDGGDDSATSMDDFWEPQRQRSRSYSDAEDIMNGVYVPTAATTPVSTSPPASNNGGNGVGGVGESNSTANRSYYDSYPYSSPSQQNGLHHRSTASSRTDRIHGHDKHYHHSSSLPHSPPRVYTRSNSHRSLLRRPHSNNNSAFHKGRRLGSSGQVFSSFSSRQFVKCCLVAGFGAYVLILIRGSILLLKNESNEVSSGVGNPYAAMLLPMGRDTWNQQQSILIREADIRMTQRAEQRRKRIHPNMAPSSLKHPSSSYETRSTSWYDVALMDQREHAHQDVESSFSEVETATVDRLCGWHARNSSQVEPQLYPASTALNSNSRVLITGILNPIGFHLALHLKEQCGVQVIAGIDSMYPNTVEHRLELQERIEILTTNIPKLSKPLLLPYVGMDSRQKKQHQQTPGVILDSTGEFNLVSLNPTHIVHLASYSLMEAMETGAAYTKSLWKNAQSPYVSEEYDPPLYEIQNSMIAMEQIFMGLADAQNDEDEKPSPHLVYSSSPIQWQNSANIDTNAPHKTAKLVDEVMADTYHSSSNIYSVGVRLPDIVYGPWSRKGSIVGNLIESTIQNWGATDEASLNLTIPVDMESNLDLVYVDDVVDSLVAAMQIRSSQPILMDVSSGVENTLLSTASTIKSFLPSLSDSKGKRLKQKQPQHALEKRPITQMLLHQQQRDGLLSNNGDSAKTGSRRFEWIAPTSPEQGLLKTVAWQLDRSAPFGGPNSIETGDELLKRHGASTCSADDVLCHKGRDFVPCLSECNIKDQCLPSIFDDVQELLQTVTEGCDIILYTHTLGHNVKDLKLHAEYMDESTLRKNDELICNFAFVPRDSDVVKTVAGRVPMEKLAKFGIKPKASDTANSIREQTLEGLNGRLLYRGWILIWVPDALEDLSFTDRSLLKLSPGKLFHKDVKRALFVEENFSVSPNIEDVQFLVAEMNRDAFNKRTVKKDITVTNPISGKEREKQVKYRLPAEPPRRAAILFAPLRYPNKHIEGHNPDKKLSIHAATKFMRYELDLDPNEKEPVEIRRQREFYERIPSYLNRNELRSFLEPWYRYSMRHWVRTRWVVHDLELEESRLLRCEWYQEHIQWESDVDQLSFAHVMAKRELERRMALHEPDDHFKTFVEEHPELHDLTDSYEWHAMKSERNRNLMENKLYREPSGNWLVKLPDHVPKDALDLDEENSAKLKENQVPLFVRIMSEKMMAVSRKSWSRHKKKKK